MEEKQTPVPLVVAVKRNRSALIGLLKDLKEAVAGTDMDFTSGAIGRAVFLLSVPMVLEMILQSCLVPG